MSTEGLCRQVVHMDLDSFFVSVERLKDSRLEGRPLLIGGTGDRAVVAACSYETRACGVHSAMPMKLARRLCPEAIVMNGDHELYSRYSREVSGLIREAVPVFEQASIDEFYLDMTGMERFFGTYTLASELRQRVVREIGLPLSFGLSTSKTVSKVATGEAKPNGRLRVAAGTEKPFLAPLPVGRLPMVGEKTATMLQGMGVSRIQTLQQMPVRLIERALGQNGRSIWERANGIDLTPVEPYSEQKSLSTEETFTHDTADVAFLRARLIAMTEALSQQLRRMPKLTGCVTIKIRYADFDTRTRQKTVAYTASDQRLLPVVHHLFDRLFERRLMIRLIGLRFSHLVGGTEPLDLFQDRQEAIRLAQAIDHLNTRFGDRTVRRAAGQSSTRGR